MPTEMEARIARARKIPYMERDLSAAVSDFYLLEALANLKYDKIAKSRLDQLENSLAREFSDYLDIAVGGELRYSKCMLGDQCPKKLEPFIRETNLGERGKAWLVWGVIRRAWGLEALKLAERAFQEPGWGSSYGGPAWAGIASVLRAYLEGRMNKRIFVDRCFSLEHNSGCVFNKLYDTRKVGRILEAHGRDEYPTLLSAASPEVRCLWRRNDFLKRMQHDEVWFGLPSDIVTFADVDRWEQQYGWSA